MELAAGDLRGFYAKPTGDKDDTYTFRSGKIVVAGAAKGLAYMHSMPSPVLHRDIKSGNIMVMKDGVGKVGDCGESRRIVSARVRSPRTLRFYVFINSHNFTHFQGPRGHYDAHRFSALGRSRGARGQALLRARGHVLAWSCHV